jgi:hypothetical protein
MARQFPVRLVQLGYLKISYISKLIPTIKIKINKNLLYNINVINTLSENY